jgi:hypothetical protein
MPEVLTTARSRRFALALLIALCIAPLMVAFTDVTGDSMVLRGDAPGFLSPAVTVARGQGAGLYDTALQQHLQNELFPSMKGNTLVSVYPPIVGLVLSPLATFTAVQAKLILTLLAAAFFLFAFRLARNFVPFIRIAPVESFLILLSLAPLYCAILAAQNSALTIFFLTGAAVLISKNTSRAEFLAGTLLGLLLYKPQFGALILVPILFAGKFAVLAGAFIAAVIWYLAGVFVGGKSWLEEWVAAATRFGAQNFEVNGFQMVSFAGVLNGFVQPLSQSGTISTLLVFLFALACLTYFAWNFYRAGRAVESSHAVARSLVCTAAALPVISPQTLFYDLSLSFLPLLATLDLTRKDDFRVGLTFYVLIQLTVLLRYQLMLPVMGFVAMAIAVFVAARQSRINFSSDEFLPA